MLQLCIGRADQHEGERIVLTRDIEQLLRIFQDLVPIAFIGIFVCSQNQDQLPQRRGIARIDVQFLAGLLALGCVSFLLDLELGIFESLQRKVESDVLFSEFFLAERLVDGGAVALFGANDGAFNQTQKIVEKGAYAHLAARLHQGWNLVGLAFADVGGNGRRDHQDFARGNPTATNPFA